MVASSWHWRRLVVAIMVLMGLAFAAPRLIRPPDIQENRALAAWPPWPRTLAEFKRFRQGVDAHVADRFPARAHLIGALNFVRLGVGVSGSERVVVGREGWLFHDDGSHLGAARDETLPPDEARLWLTGLSGRTEALRGRGVPYLVVSAPRKETIYPQYGPYWFAGPDPHRPAKLLAAMARHAGVGEILDLQPALSAAARRGVKVYSRHDTHWTGAGAYEGYTVLMSRLHDLGLTEPPRPLSAFTRVDLGANTPRDLALMLGVASFVDVEYSEFRDSEAHARLRTTYLGDLHEWVTPLVVDTGQTGKPVLLMTRDSFSHALMPFLYGHFSRLVLAHNQDGAWRADLIEQYQPDVVILEVVESGLRGVLAPAPPVAPEAAARIERTVAVFGSQLSNAPRDAPRFEVIHGTLKRRLERTAPAACSVDGAELRSERLGVVLEARGWVTELADAPTSAQGIVRLRSASVDLTAPLAVDGPRPDVAAHFGIAGAEASGFQAVLHAGRLPPGDYRLTIYRRGKRGWIACDAPQAVKLDQAAAPPSNMASISSAE